MYELLLKWGLDSLSKFTGTKSEYELAILLEAIKTKNTLIVERYKQAWNLNDKLSELIIELDAEFDDFVQSCEETDGTWKSARQFIGRLRNEFHPGYYRKLVKIRSGFEGVNDMMSGYSYVFLRLVNIDNLTSICKAKEIYSRGEISSLYRVIWTKYSEVIASMIRVTSGDLRFWVTDSPYIEHVESWAEHDLEQVTRFLRTSAKHGKRHHISIENRRGLDKFWYELKEHHEANIEQAANSGSSGKNKQDS